MIHLGNVPASSTLYIPFATYDSNGASVTMSGLATSDILIYKNGSVTQRSSTAGFTLLDTDGIDFDSVTGLHGISIDLSDNTDAGFYAAGSFYWVVISTITVSTQVVTLIAATFRIVAAENTAGTPVTDAVRLGGQAVTASGGVTFPAATLASTTNITAGTITTATNVTTVNGLAAGVITAASIAASALDGKGNWNIGKTGYALSAAQTFDLTGNITGNLSGAVGSVTGLTASDVGAIKAKTDSLTFTQAGHVDANIQRINDVLITGDGSATPFNV